MEHTLFHQRREKVLIILSGLFLATLSLLNIIGLTRFIDLSFSIGPIKIPMVVAIGVLPYPITFLCTDLISELYGKKTANITVWTGLVINLWIIFILWIAGILPGVSNQLPDPALFFKIQKLAFGAVTASMIAYLTAQFCDIHVFHRIKKATNNRHLWLRNNGSTLISQFIDSTAVILITHYYAQALPINSDLPLYTQLQTYILSAYAFKCLAALLDTIPIYIIVSYLKPYLNIRD